MDNNELENTQKSKSKMLRNVCKVIIGLFTVAIILTVIITILGITSLNNTTNSGIDGIGQALGTVIIIRLFMITTVISLPILIASICGLRYYSGKSKGKLTACWIWGIISFIGSSFVFYLVYSIFYDSFDSYTLNENKISEIIFYSIVFSILFLPNILFILGCYKEQFKTKIFSKSNVKRFFILIGIIFIGLVIFNIFKYGNNKSEKIMISDTSLHTLKEFEDELKSRGFIYDVPKGYSELAGSTDILSEDNKYEYQYDLDFKKNANDKYPLYIYEGYASLIQKSPQTAEYYTKGPEDWWISWNIYYVNGQIYAVIGDESELGSGWSTDLFRTRYGRIVSEKDKITTYNRKGNYFSYGGGIENNIKGYVRYLSSKMVDTFNNNCAEIIKVDRVDAETLDRISKELSPKYWIEYKKNN